MDRVALAQAAVERVGVTVQPRVEDVVRDAASDALERQDRVPEGQLGQVTNAIGRLHDSLHRDRSRCASFGCSRNVQTIRRPDARTGRSGEQDLCQGARHSSAAPGASGPVREQARACTAARARRTHRQ